MAHLSPQGTLKRKERLGISYSKLGELVGVSHVTIQRVLKEEKSGIAINREDILRRCNAAMDRYNGKFDPKAA